MKEELSKEQEEAGVVSRGLLRIFNGNVFVGWTPLMVRQGNLAIVSAEARATLKTGTQAIFDEVLFEARQEGFKIKYEETFSKLFSADTILDRFKKMNADEAAAFNIENNIDLTPEEVTFSVVFSEAHKTFEQATEVFNQAKAAYDAASKARTAAAKAVKAKIAKVFGPPRLPGAPSIGDIDLKQFGRSNGDEVIRWLSDATYEASYDLKRVASNDPMKCNLLRLHPSTKSLQTLSGHTLVLAQARRIFHRVKLFDEGPATRRNYFESGQNTVYIYSDYLQVGCQNIPRSEVTRFGAMMGWDVEQYDPKKKDAD